MKRKYIAAIFSILILGALLIVNQRQTKSPRVLTASLMGPFSTQIKPEDISTIFLYHINHNVWDTLVTSDRSSAAARLLKVDTAQLTYSFIFDQKAKFSNGREITAHDAVFTIDRLLKLEVSGHFNAKSLIAHAKAKSDQELEIRLNRPTPSFLFLLSTPEFGIVPKEAVDPASLEIVDATVTSGAYSISRASEVEQELELKRNLYFSRNTPNSPDIVSVKVHNRSDVVPRLLKEKAVSFTEVSDSWADQVIEESKKNSGVTINLTRPSVSVFLIANYEVVDSETARAFLEIFDSNLKFESSTERRSHQLLPNKTFGALSALELSGKKPSRAAKFPPIIRIRIGNPDSPLALAMKAAAALTGSKVEYVDRAFKGEVHFFTAAQGMNADYPEIELYLMALGPYAFVSASAEEKKLLEYASHEPDSGKRSEAIKKVSLSFLENGRIIPSTLRSYVHLFDHSKIDTSGITSYDGDIPFFKIRMLE